MLEGNYLFNFVDTEADLANYKVLILPDTIRLDDALQAKIQAFVGNGGKVLATGTSGLDKTRDAFALDLGARYIGENPYQPSYFRPNFVIPDLGKTAYIMYGKGQSVDLSGGEELGISEDPYFNRTAAHFCSHRHTPSALKRSGAGMTAGKDGIYIAWEVFSDYAESGSIVLKEMVKYALDRLLADQKTLETDLPAQGVATLTKQQNRLICHLLYASPVKRGKNVEVIEDILPVYDVAVKVKADRDVKNVYLAPQKETIPFTVEGGAVCFTVPKLENHQMIVLE